MKRAETIVVLLALVLFVLCLSTQLPSERMRWQGEARFLLTPRSNVWYTDPLLVQRQLDSISNALVNPACLKALADAADLRQSEFHLIGVVPIRSTRIVSVQFAGTDRSVERVASNTFMILEQFSFTNEPSIEKENIDYSFSRRKSVWRKWYDWLP